MKIGGIRGVLAISTRDWHRFDALFSLQARC
jgi:hypothetical protein